MERMSGIPLSARWYSFTPAQKFRILRRISQIQKSWTSIRFSKVGSLYFRKDLINAETSSYLYIDENDNEINNSKYVIGPSTAREWVEHGRQNLPCDRGPCRITLVIISKLLTLRAGNTIKEYKTSAVARERMAIEKLNGLPRQDVMVCGPKLYVPTKERKLTALELLERVLPFILPLQDELVANHIWHNDLHAENIFVNTEEPTQITGIIDWQSTYIAPLFDQTLEPSSLLDFDSELGDSLEPPELRSDINDMPLEERKAAIREFYARGLMVAWRKLLYKNSPAQYNAMIFGKSVAGNLIALGRRLYSLGEAHFMSLLLDLQKEWSGLPAVQEAGKPPFPIPFSAVQKSQILEQTKLADQSIEMMNYIAKQFGDLWPDKGLTEHDQYENVRSELRAVRDKLVNHLDLTPEQEKEFDKFWPFEN